MAKNDNNRFIYLKSSKTKIPVSEEEYQAFYRDVTRIRKREQYHGRCVCPKKYIWSCDGDCDICEYHRSDMLSLDAENTEDGANFYDMVASDSVENVVEDKMLLDKLIERFRELDPDADRILDMWRDNDRISDRKIAEKLGRPQRTFADQLKRYRKDLYKIVDDTHPRK